MSLKQRLMELDNVSTALAESVRRLKKVVSGTELSASEEMTWKRDERGRYTEGVAVVWGDVVIVAPNMELLRQHVSPSELSSEEDVEKVRIYRQTIQEMLDANVQSDPLS